MVAIVSVNTETMRAQSCKLYIGMLGALYVFGISRLKVCMAEMYGKHAEMSS